MYTRYINEISHHSRRRTPKSDRGANVLQIAGRVTRPGLLMTQNSYDYASLLSLRSANGTAAHSLPWINMAALCDCFKLNASTVPKYRALAIYRDECKVKCRWRLASERARARARKLVCRMAWVVRMIENNFRMISIPALGYLSVRSFS